MTDRLPALLLLVLVALAPASAGAIAPRAAVTYISGTSIYVDAGSAAGLREGDRLELLDTDGRTVIGALEVTEVSSRRAVCRVLQAERAPRVGDAVLLPRAVPPAPAAPAAPAARDSSRARLASDRPLRGRVGLRFRYVRDHEGGGGFSQPALDLRLDGRNLAGQVDLDVDLRARRTYRAVGPDGETQTRAYRASAAWHDRGGRYRVAVGRQATPGPAAVGLFDGLLGELSRTHFDAGIYTGTEPDPRDYGFSGDTRQHGAWVEWHARPEAARRWVVATGLAASTADGQVDREFLWLQGLYSGTRLTALLQQELDYNRGWKLEKPGTSSVEPTASYASLRWRVGRGLDLRGGFDGRRRALLWRDAVTPETEFDDSFRRGGWLGLSQRFGPRYRADFDLRTSRGGTAGGADSFTGHFAALGLSRAGVDVDVRGTVYTNDRVRGWLQSIHAAFDAGRRVRLGFGGGARGDSHPDNAELDAIVFWGGIDLDTWLGRRFYVTLSLESTSGDFERNDQLFAGASYRF